MRTLQRLFLILMVVGLMAWAVTDVAWAQGRGRTGGGTTGTGFQYVIKFLCGDFAPASIGEVAPGNYFTDINIHNPNDKIIKFRKKVAVDGVPVEHHGLQTSPVDVILGPDEALEINCSDLFHLTGGFAPFSGLEGFVVLYSKVKLDVAAIYSACGFVSPAGLSVSAQQTDCTATKGGSGGITTIQVDELIPANGVPPPAVFVKGLSVNSAGVNLSIEPFSEVGYDGAKLMIYDANGQLLHDSSFTSGTELSWKPQSLQGRPLANGVYLYVVTVRDALGNVAYKAGKFALLR